MKIEPSQNVGMDLNFGGMRDAVLEHKCIAPPMGCGRVLSDVELTSYDTLTFREYRQSGWCAECQAVVFAPPEDDEEYEEDVCDCEYVNEELDLSYINSLGCPIHNPEYNPNNQITELDFEPKDLDD